MAKSSPWAACLLTSDRAQLPLSTPDSSSGSPFREVLPGHLHLEVLREPHGWKRECLTAATLPRPLPALQQGHASYTNTPAQLTALVQLGQPVSAAGSISRPLCDLGPSASPLWASVSRLYNAGVCPSGCRKTERDDTRESAGRLTWHVMGTW